jgi:hypothetical protein
MKRILFAFGAVFLLFILVACDYEEAEHPNLAYIQDFEYLVEVLRDNFPYFGMAERRYGVDVEAIIENTRNVLHSQEIRDDMHFSRILQSSFTGRLRNIGHLFPQDSDIIHLILGNIYRGPINYNGRPVYLHGRTTTYWGLKFKELVRSETAQQFYGLIEVDLGYEEGMIIPNNIRMEILDETAGIAYIRVNQFWHYNIDHDKALVFEFYEQIRDFEHLIIDLRGNPGGFTRYFIQIFMAPNIPYDLELGIHTLFMGGASNLAWFAADVRDAYVFSDFELEKFYAAEYMYGRFEYMNPYDAALLDYIVLRPVFIASDAPEGEILFNGKIWILVDSNSASAVDYAALYAMAADFATIVGAPTRGVTGGGFVGFITLPNTGLIVRYDFGYFVDSYGRAIDEFGIMPHYLNLPGMDALETTLTLIEGR